MHPKIASGIGKVKDRLLMLMSVMSTQMASASNIDALDSLDHFIQHNILIINAHKENSWGELASSIALKEYIEGLGHKVKSLSTNQIGAIESIPDGIEGFKDPSEFALFKEENGKLIRSIQRADVVVISGADTMGQSSYLLLYLAYISKAYLGKITQLVNHSCYPQGNLEIDDIESSKLYSYVYNEMDYIALQELFSSQLMRILHVENRLATSMLPQYIKNHFDRVKGDQREITLGGIDKLSKDSYLQIIGYLMEMEEAGYQITILTHPKNSLERAYPGSWNIERAESIDDWLNAINRTSLFVSQDFHEALAALYLHTPLICLKGESPANEALLRMTTGYRTIDPDEGDLARVLLAKTEFLLNCPYEELDFASREQLDELALNNFATNRCSLGL